MIKYLPSPSRDCVTIAGEEERQSDSKDLECGSFRELETVVRIMSNVFIGLGRQNLNY